MSEFLLLSCQNPVEVKIKEVELGCHSWMVCLAAELLIEECIKSPGETKSREVELGSHSWMVCLAAELFFNSCFLDRLSL